MKVRLFLFPIGIYDTCKGHQEQNGQEKRKNTQTLHSLRGREKHPYIHLHSILIPPPPPPLSLSLSLSFSLSLSLSFIHFRLQTHRLQTSAESKSEKEGNKIRNLVVVVDFVSLTHLLVVYIPSHLCV